ncbi:hypothetical protein [Cupriavidus necator]
MNAVGCNSQSRRGTIAANIQLLFTKGLASTLAAAFPGGPVGVVLKLPASAGLSQNTKDKLLHAPPGTTPFNQNSQVGVPVQAHATNPIPNARPLQGETEMPTVQHDIA